jgi:hypothetical protein
VASSMHRYWPGLYPADYSRSSFEAPWLETYGNEVFFTMHEANYHLSQLKRYVDKAKDTSLLILSSMGQAAVDGEVLISHQLLLKDKEAFMHFLGLSKSQWSSERAMSPRFVFRIHEEIALQKLREKLPKLTINGEPLDVMFYEHGVVRMKLGQANLKDEEIVIALNGKPLNFERLGLENTHIEDSTASFAYHVPQGSCLIYNPNQAYKKQATKPLISTAEIAPAILSAFGVRPPPYMKKVAANIFH